MFKESGYSEMGILVVKDTHFRQMKVGCMGGCGCWELYNTLKLYTKGELLSSSN